MWRVPNIDGLIRGLGLQGSDSPLNVERFSLRSEVCLFGGLLRRETVVCIEVPMYLW